MTKDEKELIRKFLQSTPSKALRLLYDKFYKTLLRVSMSFTKDEVVADDIVQDAFISLWKNRDTLKEEHSSLLHSSDSIPAIKFFDTWYTARMMNDMTEIFCGIVDDGERRKMKWRFKAALVSVRNGNTFDDTKKENAKVLRLAKKGEK